MSFYQDCILPHLIKPAVRQAQRGIVEFSFKDHEPGPYMFHAPQSEFAEPGWSACWPSS